MGFLSMLRTGGELLVCGGWGLSEAWVWPGKREISGKFSYDVEVADVRRWGRWSWRSCIGGDFQWEGAKWDVTCGEPHQLAGNVFLATPVWVRSPLHSVPRQLEHGAGSFPDLVASLDVKLDRLRLPAVITEGGFKRRETSCCAGVGFDHVFHPGNEQSSLARVWLWLSIGLLRLPGWFAHWFLDENRKINWLWGPGCYKRLARLMRWIEGLYRTWCP